MNNEASVFNRIKFNNGHNMRMFEYNNGQFKTIISFQNWNLKEDHNFFKIICDKLLEL